MEKQCNARVAKFKDRSENRYGRKGNLNEKGKVERVGDFGFGPSIGYLYLNIFLPHGARYKIN